MREHCDVAVVGGGPVGLLMGLALAQQGLCVRVLERATERRKDSRAIGIHPPGLACLASVGIAEQAIARGVCVTHGQAYADGAALGNISFERLGPPYPFVLWFPQTEVEALLEERLARIAPTSLVTGAEVTAVQSGAEQVKLEVRRGIHAEPLTARFVVACDGKRSAVRECAGISFHGGSYPDAYMMGDFHDGTRLGPHAGIFLSRRGLVESFPLPGAKRRWVLRLDAPESPDVHALSERIAARTGMTVDPGTCSMLSAFTAEAFLADRFASGRVVLAGDAGHVVSPIGGQGLNLGWLDACYLAKLLPRILWTSRPGPMLQRYDEDRRRAARSARRRAEVFMRLGRPSERPRLRNVLVRSMLSQPIAQLSARLFTMAGERKAG